MKEAIYNNIFGRLTDEQETDIKGKIDKRFDSTFKENEEKGGTLNQLRTKIEEGKTQEEKKYLKYDSIKSYYTGKEVELLFKKLDEDKKKEKEKEKEKETKVVYKTEYYESEESKEYRRRKALEEQNKRIASENLPKFLDEVKYNYFSKLKENVIIKKEIIEKELFKYDPLILKNFLQNLTENEKLIDKLIEYSKKESEKYLNKSYEKVYHLNLIFLGKSGVGKSTLINGIFEYNENEGAKTGDGQSITKNLMNIFQIKEKV